MMKSGMYPKLSASSKAVPSSKTMRTSDWTRVSRSRTKLSSSPLPSAESDSVTSVAAVASSRTATDAVAASRTLKVARKLTSPGW